ncbi:hypothetical protein PEC302110_11420 [Pectobacterium araliae]|uniref:Uncharacterized protein n=1 Tax=Pectobacterium araliae TaxID=3073862 RepID=A0AAN0MKE8_9GAMM|nr:hypothetical protein PEC302110_11420 [Pectobacterium sp. MAFF 302110]
MYCGLVRMGARLCGIYRHHITGDCQSICVVALFVVLLLLPDSLDVIWHLLAFVLSPSLATLVGAGLDLNHFYDEFFG